MFLHPGLAALGIGLVAVPIVIHLLNRRRFQIVRFGAMDFLRNAYRRTRRRLELENLLLLLLRALAVLLLGLAIARPSLDSQPPLIGNVGGARRDVVLALDASWSMGWRDGGSSSYDRGVAAARAILETLKPERQDRASLILAKRRPLRLSSTDVGKARDELSRHAEPSFEGMDLAATLDLVANEVDALDPDVPPEARNVSTTLYFLTDLQRSTFTPRAARAESSPAAGSSGPSPLQTAMAALAARKVAVRVIDVGPSGDGIPDNAGVVSVTSGDELAPVGAPVELRVAVRNFGSSPRTAATLTPTVDGDRQAVQTLDLPAAQEREIVVPLTFRESGDHAVEIALEEDRLGADDRRSFAIHVRPALRVLLVDGADQPDADPELSATGMIELVLSPPEEPTAIAPFSLLGGHAFGRVAFASQPELLEQADVLVLADVGSFSEEQAAAITAFAKRGGGVLFILGPHVDPASYAARLRAGSDPRAWIFPGAPGEAKPPREARPWRVAQIVEPVPSELRFFAPPERRVLLTEVPVSTFLQVDVTKADADAGSHVLARYGDPDASPFLIVKELGRGRVAAITTSLDNGADRWSRISESVKTFVPLIFDLLNGLTGGVRDTRNVRVGDALRVELAGAPQRATVVDPAGQSHAVDVDPAERLVTYSGTDRPGLYKLDVEVTGAVAATSNEVLWCAVGLDPEEGDLARLPAASIDASFPGVDLKLVKGFEEETTPPVDSPRSEIWKALLAGALGALALESALATWFGRRRK